MGRFERPRSGSYRTVEIRLPRRQFGSGFMVDVRVRIPSDAQQLQQAARERLRVKNFGVLHAQRR